jgi:hypothetical protein
MINNLIRKNHFIRLIVLLTKVMQVLTEIRELQSGLLSQAVIHHSQALPRWGQPLNQ